MAVLAEDCEVLPRLEQLGLRRDLLLDVVQAAVGARRTSSGFHPLSAGGSLSYIEGTAHLRRVFTKRGWQICRRDNIESIYHPILGLKVVFQNAERAGDVLFDPTAISKKGAGSARAIEYGQLDFWPKEIESTVIEITSKTWVLFVFADGDDVRAELSCPVAINENHYDGFHERILLVEKGGWGNSGGLVDDDEPPVDYEVSISRRN